MNLSKSQYRQLVKLLLKLSRYDIKRLQAISRQQFGRKTNTLNSIFKQGKCSFRSIKNDAYKQLIDFGAANPKVLSIKDGKYLIVSDSHGKHTSRGMFRLLNSLYQNLNIDAIIHIGHILDDDNDISYLWKNFPNVIVVARQQQIKEVQKRKQEYKYNIINGYVEIGNTRIYNQQFIKDYSKNTLGCIDSYLFPFNCVFSGHRQELMNKGNNYSSIAHYLSGCVCQPHIVTTVKQIDFKDGTQIKQSYPSTFQVYRNRKFLLNYWEQGAVILQCKNGITSIHPIRIKKYNNEYYTSYYDKIYTEYGIQKPQKKIFFNSDMHVDKQDDIVLNLQNKFVSRYQPDIYVNLGDMLNNKSLNHHELERGAFIQSSFLKQYKEYCKIMKQISNWAKQKHIIFGNHQRFINDFSDKYPQLKQLFYFLYTSPIKQFNFKSYSLGDIVQIENMKFLHGDLKLYGQNGIYLDKISKTFGSDTIVGHLHVNEIRRGCYIVGLSGKYDQGYNDVNGSRWTQGFGFTNCYKGMNFTQLININKQYNFIIDNVIYQSKPNELKDNNTEIKVIVK